MPTHSAQAGFDISSAETPIDTIPIYAFNIYIFPLQPFCKHDTNQLGPHSYTPEPEQRPPDTTSRLLKHIRPLRPDGRQEARFE